MTETRCAIYSAKGMLIRELEINPDGTFAEPFTTKAGEILMTFIETDGRMVGTPTRVPLAGSFSPPHNRHAS